MSDTPKLATEDQVKSVADTFTELYNHQGKQIKSIESGIIDTIVPSSPAPTKRGQYVVSAVGVYINFKDSNNQAISVTEEEFTSGVVYLIYNGTNSRKIVVSIEANGEVKEGDQRPVSGAMVYENSALKSDLNIATYEDITGEVTTGVYPSESTGLDIESSGYKSSGYLPVFRGDLLLISGWSFSATSALVVKYNSEKNRIGSINKGNGTAQYYDSYLLKIDFDGYIRITGRAGNTYKCKALKEILKPKFETKSDSELKYNELKEQINYLPRVKNYGIRFSIESNNSTCERIHDSIGLSAQARIGTNGGKSDFDTIYPWSEMKRVNIKVLTTGAKKLTYENEQDFNIDGSNGDVFVEIPKFYFSRYIQDGYDYRIISSDGKELHPAFIEDGKILDKIYVAAYESSLVNNEMKSISNQMPWNNITASEMMDKVKEKGLGYQLYDLRTVDVIQNLMWIEYANRNSSLILGQGFSDFVQPASSEYRSSIINEYSTNRFITKKETTESAISNFIERMFVGCNLLICKGSQENIVAYRKVTKIVLTETTKEIYFDGESIDVEIDCFIGNAPQNTGWADFLGYHTGQIRRPKETPSSTVTDRMKNANKYRNVENISGNVWHYLPDITFVGGTPYISNSIKDYEFFKTTESYKPLALELPIQEDNTEGKWMLQSSFDHLGKYTLGTVFGTSEWNQRFGAYYYMGAGSVAIANGGGFDHRERCNIATNRAWINNTRQWYLYGCRMIYKNI